MKKKRNTRSTAKDIIITVLCLVGIGAAVFLFYKDLNISLKSDSEQIGVIYFKQNTAQRRLQGRNLWERLKVTSPIYEGDRIRTGDLSEASAVFNDGSSISIHENTLVQLFQGNDRTVQFMNGSISVVSGSESDGISVKTGDKIINFTENTSAVISLPQKTEVYENKDNKVVQQATVVVTSGEAKISVVKEPKNSIEKISQKVVEKVTGEPVNQKVEQTVVAGNAVVVETAVVIDESESDVYTEEIVKEVAKINATKKEENPFVVYMPSSSYSITQSNSKDPETVPFMWNNFDKITIEVSFTPSFTEIVDTQIFDTPLRKGSAVFDFARPDDILYWRAVPTENKSENQKYPSGKIFVKAPVKKIVKETVASVYEDKKAEQISERRSIIEESVALKTEKIVSELPKAQSVEKVVAAENTSFAEKLAEQEREAKRKAEEARLEAERKKAEEARQIELKRQEEARKKAEAEKIAEAKRKAEAEKKRIEEQKQKEAEKKRLAELKKKEEERQAAEAKKKEEARLAELKRQEEAKKAAEAKKKEEERLAELKRQEEARKAAEAKKAEEERKAEIARKKAEERIAELKRLEEERKAEKIRKEKEEAEKARKAAQLKAIEDARKAEEQRILEEKRKAEEENRRIEEERKAKEARKAEIIKRAEEARKAEEARLAEEAKKQEEARLAEEKRKLEEGRLILEAKKAEAERLEKERLLEEARKAEEERIAEEARKAEEERLLAEAKRIEEEKKAEEARLLAEAKRLEEERLAKEAKLAEEARKAEEAAKAEQERKAAEEKKSEAAKKAEEAKRKTEEKKMQEEQNLSENIVDQQVAEEVKSVEEEKKVEENLPKITKIEPVLLNPKNMKVFTDEDFSADKKPQVIFTWRAVEDAMAYRFVLKTKDGKNLLVKTVNSPKYVLSDKIKLISDSGEYEWSVTALTKIDDKTYTSLTSSRKFRVQLTEIQAASLDSTNLITTR